MIARPARSAVTASVILPCPYCGGTSPRRNHRDGLECSSCGAPVNGTSAVPVPVVPVQRGHFTYDGAGGIVEVEALLREQWERGVLVDQLFLNEQDFHDVALLIIEHSHPTPVFRPTGLMPYVPRPIGAICGWYYSRHAPHGGQLLPVHVRSDAVWPSYTARHP